MNSCHHRHDQGAICFTQESFVNWGTVASTVQPCADTTIVDDTNMALFFHCVQFATVACTYDISGGTGSFVSRPTKNDDFSTESQ